MKHCKYLSFVKKTFVGIGTSLILIKQIRKGKHMFEVLLAAVYGPNSLEPGQRRSLLSVPPLALATLTPTLNI